MARTVLADTGAIVAALHRRDHHHPWARAQFGATNQPFVTCEAVISECFFLLEGAAGGKQALCKLLERQIILIDFSTSSELLPTLALLKRYSDLPMSFADACLVRMSELLEDAVVMTTDHDFRIYRRKGRQTITTMMPSD